MCALSVCGSPVVCVWFDHTEASVVRRPHTSRARSAVINMDAGGGPAFRTRAAQRRRASDALVTVQPTSLGDIDYDALVHIAKHLTLPDIARLGACEN